MSAMKRIPVTEPVWQDLPRCGRQGRPVRILLRRCIEDGRGAGLRKMSVPGAAAGKITGMSPSRRLRIDFSLFLWHELAEEINRLPDKTRQQNSRILR